MDSIISYFSLKAIFFTCPEMRFLSLDPMNALTTFHHDHEVLLFLDNFYFLE
ncbi:hypothetical protein GIB67_020975 [Kingdonia uniflora]|uniref:Uncharacterized protein n=1 Tax=Kingdonia uniflora TaxID=39325 RepID=A0A7J7M7S7_9MAGN|nr:hypothetical protein GIB67_020975 [Kingdonia uniflora]